MPTLSDNLTTWRGQHQPTSDTRGLMSLLTIDDKLYDIKDPAVEYLAEQVEARLNAIDSKTIRQIALSKDVNASKFATEVTQGVDGQISVTYSDAQTTDVKRAATAAVTGQAEVRYTAEEAAAYNEEHSLNDGDEGYVHENDVKTPGIDPQIALSGTTTEAALIEIAKAIAIEQIARANGDTSLSASLIGSSSDLSSADTINAAKKYADEAVANLAGTDWEQNAKKVQEIIAEIENADNANAWATAIDKLAGLGIKTPAVHYTQEECDEYNTANNLEDGDEGYRTTSDVKTPAVYNTVKDYVDAAIAAAGFDVSTLAATVRGNLDANDDITTDHKVGVKIVEQNGVITSVTVVEDDIASAADLATLTSDVENHAEVTAAALTDLDTRLTTLGTTVGNIDLTVKANKAAITTATINNWTASYTAQNENLVWTNTQTTVYVPVSGQSL